MRLFRRFWPVLLLVAVIVAAWSSGIAHHIGWTTLARNQSDMARWVDGHPFGAPALYTIAYAIVVALSFPEAAVVTVAGGLLFGTIMGGLLAVVGSTLGSLVLFLAVRHHLANHRNRLVDRIRTTLKEDGFSYLLAIRLIPAFPFWLVNLAAGLSGMRLLPYATATVIGIVPTTFVYASIGAGVGKVLAEGGAPDLTIVFSAPILGPLVGFAALSLLPVVWRHWRR